MKPQEQTIHFAHSAYQLAERLAERETGMAHFQTWSVEETGARIGDGDILVISGFWHNDLLARVEKLRLIQACGAGVDQFDQDAIQARNIRLANASGVNANAVSEHALALILALTRQLHLGRDNQRAGIWRGMISDPSQREDELPGKSILIYGLGAIGGRIARLAQAFGMRVIGIKRDLSAAVDAVDELLPPVAFHDALPGADFVVLSCPLTAATRNLIDAPALAAMRPSAYLINVARGGCVDEPALIDALEHQQIAGAGLDVVVDEPLSPASPLWAMDNVLLTPHTGGETRKYEDNVIDILLDNIDRLARGEDRLRNQII